MRKGKRKNKRSFILVCLLIETIYVMITIPVLFLSHQKENGEEAKQQEAYTNMETVKANTNQPLDWKLIIASKEHPIPDDYEVQLATIEGDLKFDQRAIGELNQLRNAARKAGYTNLWVQSSYRSIETQETLFKNKVNEYKRMGKTEQKAEELANKIVNRAGESDHNLGLAVDFNYVEESFKDLSVYKWLCNHAHEYGFILRYPKEKEEITNVSYEPWHWRYVGKEYAKEIKEKGYCLEEYVKSR